jgi:hypothetical protein
MGLWGTHCRGTYPNHSKIEPQPTANASLWYPLPSHKSFFGFWQMYVCVWVVRMCACEGHGRRKSIWQCLEIFGWHNQGKCSWHLVCKDQGYYKKHHTTHGATPTPQESSSPMCQQYEVEKPCFRAIRTSARTEKALWPSPTTVKWFQNSL